MSPRVPPVLLVLVSLIIGQVVTAPAEARPDLGAGVEGKARGADDPTGNGPTRFVAPSGSDRGSCRRASPCKTFDRAYQVAKPGETVSVAGGTYGSTWHQAGAHAVMRPGKPAGSAPISFVCSGVVTFDATAPNFMIYPGVHSLTFTGGCFRFHIVQIGLGGYADRVHGITFNGVKMDGFECAGCDDLTIRNSEIGPLVACHGKDEIGVGNNGGEITAAMRCQPTDAGSGAYWASRPRGNSDVQIEPYIHNGAAGVPQNIVLDGTLIHGMQTKDPLNMHTGGLLIWNANGVVMRNNVFKNNAIYDVLVDGRATNFVVENNFFGWPVQPLGNGVGAVETPKDWREFGSKDTVVHRNWLIRYNSFAHGIVIGRNSLDNVRVVANILGTYSNCTAGVRFHSNVTIAARPCGVKGTRRQSFPYVDYKNVNFHLRPNVALPVPTTTADANLLRDFDRDLRQVPRSAGADE